MNSMRKGHDFRQSTLSSCWGQDQVGSDHPPFWDYQDKDRSPSKQSAATSQHLSLGYQEKKKKKKESARFHPYGVTCHQCTNKTSANIACICVMQPGDLGFSWMLACWHNKQSAISLQPCHRAKLEINCSSNSRYLIVVPPIHLFFSLLSLPLPCLVFHPWLAWRSLRLITGKDPINKLSSHKTV